jgi:hypothetical protein
MTFPIYRHAVFEYLRKARGGEAGGSDGCALARILIQSGLGDEDLAQHYLRLWRQATEFLDKIEARCALFNVAEALQRERLLTGEQVAELVDVESLREARASIDNTA